LETGKMIPELHTGKQQKTILSKIGVNLMTWFSHSFSWKLLECFRSFTNNSYRLLYKPFRLLSFRKDFCKIISFSDYFPLGNIFASL
jgi:hypothetical protein